MHHPAVLADKIFIVPDATFLFELVLFLIVFGLMRVLVVPALQKTMSERAETIRQQLAEAQAAHDRLEEAEAAYRAALSDTKAEATRIREQARAEGRQIIEELRGQARAQADQVHAANLERLETTRLDVMTQLRPEIGRLATDLSSRIVGEPIGEEPEQRESVSRFLDGLAVGVQTAKSIREA